MTMSQLEKYQMYIGGKWVDPISAAWLESDNPYDGKPWALIPRGNEEDANRAVAAARAAFTERRLARHECDEPGRAPAPARRSGGAGCGAPRRRRGARQRQAHQRDERAAQVRPAVVLLFRRPGGQGRGRRHPDRQGQHVQLHPPRAARRGGGDHGLELAASARGLQARACARRRQHGRAQALGIHLGVGARVRQARRRGRLPARRRQRGHGDRPGGRRGADLAPRRGQGRLHRRQRDGQAHLRDRGVRSQARHPRAWRQVPQHRVRGRGSRGCGEGGDLRHLRGDGADLRRGLPPAAARARPRRVRGQAPGDREDGAAWAIRWTRGPRWAR